MLDAVIAHARRDHPDEACGIIEKVGPGVQRVAAGDKVVVSYLLFALLVGTITRGVLPREESEETSQADDDETR